MVRTLALSTTSFFSYTPDIGLVKREIGKKYNMKVETMTSNEDW
jgi:hypothetical protein